MDYERLIKLIPKPSITWNISDIQIWLDFIGLNTYSASFKMSSVDGSCLCELTEDDLKQQLQIESKIIRRKIMTWIKQGIHKFDDFLQKTQKAIISSQCTQSIQSKLLQTQKKRTLQYELKREESLKSEQQNQFIQNQNSKWKGKRQTLQHMNEKHEINQLRIKQCQASISCCYSLKEQGGMIGRNSKNEIHIIDESISRFHAQIQYQDGIYYIRDFGSSSGTFIRISQKTPLQNMQIIQMGSNQFLVDLSNYKILKLNVIEGPNVQSQYSINYSKSKINIGRKATNQISFPDDQHLSNIHSTIFTVQGLWYIQDIGTTNGTWIRLSAQGIKSNRYKLQNQTQFKLGSSLTYQCLLSNYHRKTQKEKSEKCQICKFSQKDCIFLPCKHNMICYKCCISTQVANCISCGSAIVQSMKIYKV